jgi:hypothetical protein
VLRGDHALVETYAQYFVDDEAVTPNEQPTVFDQSLAELEARHRAAEKASREAKVQRAERNPVKPTFSLSEPPR